MVVLNKHFVISSKKRWNYLKLKKKYKLGRSKNTSDFIS